MPMTLQQFEEQCAKLFPDATDIRVVAHPKSTTLVYGALVTIKGARQQLGLSYPDPQKEGCNVFTMNSELRHHNLVVYSPDTEALEHFARQVQA